MKIYLLGLLALISLTAFADESYRCLNLEKGSSLKEVTLKISTSLLTHQLKSVELVRKIKGRSFEAGNNPFIGMSVAHYDLDQSAVKEASELEFQELIEDTPTNSTISLSDSIVNHQQKGFAYFYGQSCFWILDCTSTSHFFKCERN